MADVTVERPESEWVRTERQDLAIVDRATWDAVQARHDTVMGGVGPRSTPTIDGGRVYALGATGILRCLETSSGKELWQSDTLKEFGAANLFFGMSCSPLVEGKHVLVNVGGNGASFFGHPGMVKAMANTLANNGRTMGHPRPPSIGT